VCPFCQAEHEKSFVVRVDAQDGWKVWYRCYRAACGVKGRYSDSEGLRLAVKAPTENELFELDYQDMPVPRRVAIQWGDRYGLTDTTIRSQGVRYSEEKGELAFPIKNMFEGRVYQVGWQTRRIAHKVIRFHWLNSTKGSGSYSYYHPNELPGTKPLVIVESIQAAYRVWQDCPGYAAVALLGHEIPSVGPRHWRYRHRDAILLLDPDTWPTGVTKAIRRLEADGINTEARYLDKKPHQLTADELREAVS
jgi:hypothetical protein